MSRRKTALTFTDDLRSRVKDRLGYCKTCGQSTESTTRETAKKVGIPHTNLWRFLSGKQPSADTINALVLWLEGKL